MDRQKDRTLKDECPGSAQYWLRMEKSLQRAKRLGQSRNEAQPQLRLVVKVKPDAVRTALHRDPGITADWPRSDRRRQE